MLKKIILTLCLAVFSLGVSAQNHLTPEKLWELKRVGQVAPSPDGKWIVYTMTTYDIKENKGNTDIWRIASWGGKPYQLTSFPGSEYSITWRPDGKRIAFMSAQGEAPELWEMNPNGSNMQKVKNAPKGISNVQYSPDMKHILYTQSVKINKTVNELYPDLPHANARIIDDLMYRHWNQWDDFSNSHVFYTEYSAGEFKGESTDIMLGQPYDSPTEPFGGSSDISWSSDGMSIAYTCKKLTGKEYAESTNTDIYIYNLASGNTINISEGMPGYDKEPVFSPNGKYLAWSSMERGGFESDRNRVFIYDMANKSIKELTKGFGRDANGPQWNKYSNKLYFTSGVNATYQIFEINLSGRTRQLTRGKHNYSGIHMSGNNIVTKRMSMSMPYEIYRVSASGGQRRLTTVNTAAMGKLKMGQIKEKWVTTTDGKKMLVWVILPPDYRKGKKYPALLYCQGGPQSAVSQFFSFRWNFQLMAAQGYVVIAPNRRGLPSFGRKWNDDISKDWGGQAMKDYLSAVDAISKESYIDKDRIGAVGASFGGYSVYWLAGNHENRFKAFISHCGLFNLESWYGTTEEMFFANWDIGGPYWDQSLSADYNKFSPHKFVKNWDTPMLVIHGEKDFRVPIGEGMQAFQAAQLQNIPSRFLYFPKEGHWVLQPQNGLLWHRVFFEWLDQHVKNNEQQDN